MSVFISCNVVVNWGIQGRKNKIMACFWYFRFVVYKICSCMHKIVFFLHVLWISRFKLHKVLHLWGKEQANSNCFFFWFGWCSCIVAFENKMCSCACVSWLPILWATNQFQTHIPVTPSVQGGAKGERITALDRQVGRIQRSWAVSCEMQWSFLGEQHLVGLMRVKYNGVYPVGY